MQGQQQEQSHTHTHTITTHQLPPFFLAHIQVVARQAVAVIQKPCCPTYLQRSYSP